MNSLGEKLVCVGALIILVAFGILLYENYEDNKAMKVSENTLEKLNEIIFEEDSNDENNKEKNNTKKIDEYDYIGIINIPSINVELPVISDWSYKKLKSSPCVYYGSIEENNLVILAHSYKSHFRYLNKLNEKDKVVITDINGNNYVYEVVFKDVLNPNNSNKVIEVKYDLVLFSCYNSGTQRIAVYCNKVK